jgi:SAM-dependent methyltransferase
MKISVARRLYRLIPHKIRKTSAFSRISALLQSRVLPHNWVYDESYYIEAVETTAGASSHVIVNTILRDIKPRSVVDIGCGTGVMLEVFRDNGCKIFGLERSSAALSICRSRKLDVKEFDLEDSKLQVDGTFDLVLSMEVAEHLPQKVDENYVRLLTELAPTVVFTAAPPGQGGTDHINEQPPEYWEAKFERYGFIKNQLLTRKWQKEWNESGVVSRWYFSNLMVFQKRGPSLYDRTGGTSLEGV